MSDHSTNFPEEAKPASCKIVTCRVCGLEKEKHKHGGNICYPCLLEAANNKRKGRRTRAAIVRNNVRMKTPCPECGQRGYATGKLKFPEDGGVSRERQCSNGHKFFVEYDDFVPNSRRNEANKRVEKFCNKCQKTLPISEFGKDADKLPRTYCRSCYNLDRQNYREDDLLKKYGITREEYYVLLDKQKGLCSICKTSNPGSARLFFSIDHCHKTGKLRGLLCNKCNIGLGYFDDDMGRLNSAAYYLRYHSEQS